MTFEKAAETDIDAVGVLYDSVCDWLEENENYPHWKKDVYPTRADAEEGYENGSLYVCRDGDAVVGTVRLSHVPEEGYSGVKWGAEDDYDRILVLYALAVHPDYMGKGVGRMIMAEAEKIARAENCFTMRLDVVKGNIPAETLYKDAGFRFVTTKSLGYEKYGIPWYDLYEKILLPGQPT